MQSKTPQAVQHCHELLAWLIPHLDKFPRIRRFTLGERLEAGLLTVLELLIEASYTSQKLSLLNKANSKLAVVRHLWRLAFELGVIPLKRYEVGSQKMVELGSQIGGWRKSATD